MIRGTLSALAALLLVLSGAGHGDTPGGAVAKAVASAVAVPDPRQRPAAPAASPVPEPRDAEPVTKATPEDALALPPRPRRRIPPSCTADGEHCIGPLRYLADVCAVIGDTASEAGIDPWFFARLIWRESLFDPYAVSPAGALGIAQFIPETAARRGLDDPFNPAAALQASARYLRFLERRFGNPGLAAGAYNGGEARMARYLAEGGTLPGETRAYVHWITGHPAARWRSDPPESLDLRFDSEASFPEACVAWARAQKAPMQAPELPWGMIYAAHADRETAAQRAETMRGRFPALLGDADPTVRQTRLPGGNRHVFAARLDTESRMAASRLCTRLRRAGGGCMVLRN